MALGGVATGSMKAKEALRVQGIITYRGFKLIDWDWVRTHTEKQLSFSKCQYTDMKQHLVSKCKTTEEEIRRKTEMLSFLKFPIK